MWIQNANTNAANSSNNHNNNNPVNSKNYRSASIGMKFTQSDIQSVPLPTYIQSVPLPTYIQSVPLPTYIQSVPLPTYIQGVPLPNKPGSSLIIPKPIKILQRDLNRSTFVGEKWRGMCLQCAPSCCAISSLVVKLLKNCRVWYVVGQPVQITTNFDLEFTMCILIGSKRLTLTDSLKQVSHHKIKNSEVSTTCKIGSLANGTTKI
jgi:hypothetical protein